MRYILEFEAKRGLRFNTVKKIHHIWVNGIMILNPTLMKLFQKLFGHATLLLKS